MLDILRQIIVSRLAQLVERVTSNSLRNDEVSRSSRLMGIIFLYLSKRYISVLVCRNYGIYFSCLGCLSTSVQSVIGGC